MQAIETASGTVAQSADSLVAAVHPYTSRISYLHAPPRPNHRTATLQIWSCTVLFCVFSSGGSKDMCLLT